MNKSLELAVRELIYEMNDGRNDGMSQELYKNELIKLKRIIDDGLRNAKNS